MYKLYIAKSKTSKQMLEKYHLNGDIFYNEFGKPYIKGKPFFNISHSGNMIVLVISDKEVGVDIQKITYKKKLLKKCFKEDEIKNIKNQNDFTKIWVKKESYVKMKGKGLSYGLINVDTKKLNIKTKKYKNYYIAVSVNK